MPLLSSAKKCGKIVDSQHNNTDCHDTTNLVNQGAPFAIATEWKRVKSSLKIVSKYIFLAIRIYIST
ncbi:MAG: hypothetical protein ACJAYJ_001232 [Saprospiraceae bacterium]|jgi:hypothetical protein